MESNERLRRLREARRRVQESVQFEFILVEGTPGHSVSSAEEVLARQIVTDALFGGDRGWEARLRGDHGPEAQGLARRLAVGDYDAFREASKPFESKPASEMIVNTAP